MVQNGPNGRKWSKMVKNGRPDLKRAQRTGLSARRARRTKSRGPRGLQLEVGARRAPRLLVFYILYSCLVAIPINLALTRDFLSLFDIDIQIWHTFAQGWSPTFLSCPLSSIHLSHPDPSSQLSGAPSKSYLSAKYLLHQENHICQQICKMLFPHSKSTRELNIQAQTIQSYFMNKISKKQTRKQAIKQEIDKSCVFFSVITV